MFQRFSLLTIGALTIITPHFLLPLHFVQGGRSALVITFCSAWYHPELWLGALIVSAALLNLRWDKFHLVALAGGFLLAIHAAVLQPLSYYLPSSDLLVVLSHRSSMRSHTHLQFALSSLSALTVIFTLYPYFLSGRRFALSLSPISLALRNIRQRIFRTTALVVALAIVIGAFFTDILLTNCIQSTLEVGAGRLGADLMIVPKGEEENAQTVLISGKPSRFYMSREVLEPLSRIDRIEAISPQLYLRPYSYLVCCTLEDFLIVAYDPSTDFTVTPWIQYFLKGTPDKFDLVVGQTVKAYPGQTMSVYGRLLNITASLDPTGIGYFDNSVFLPMEGAIELLKTLRDQTAHGHPQERQEIKDLSLTHLFSDDSKSPDELTAIEAIDPDSISAVFVKLQEEALIDDVSSQITAAIPGVSVVKVKDSTISVKRSLTSLLGALVMPIVILLIMGTVILAVIFSMSAQEKRKEIGLLRAMGAKPRQVFAIFFWESLIISTMGGFLGILFGSILLLVFKHHIMAALDLLYIWPSLPIILGVMFLTLTASVTVGILAGFYPSLRAAGMEPYYAIRSGGD